MAIDSQLESPLATDLGYSKVLHSRLERYLVRELVQLRVIHLSVRLLARPLVTMLAMATVRQMVTPLVPWSLLFHHLSEHLLARYLVLVMVIHSQLANQLAYDLD